jgi:hypothetical protein
VRQGEAFEIVGVALLAEDHRALDLVRIQIAAAPDDVAVSASGESLLRAATTLLLTRACMSIYRFEQGHMVAVPA